MLSTKITHGAERGLLLRNVPVQEEDVRPSGAGVPGPMFLLTSSIMIHGKNIQELCLIKHKLLTP